MRPVKNNLKNHSKILSLHYVSKEVQFNCKEKSVVGHISIRNISSKSKGKNEIKREVRTMSTVIVTAAFVGVLVAKWHFYNKYYSHK